MLGALYPALRRIPFYVELLPSCHFLHFGSTRQLVESGLALIDGDGIAAPEDGTLVVNSLVGGKGSISGGHSWVEGCRISAPLDLAGANVVIGLDVNDRFHLPREACLDVLSGTGRRNEPVWFVRCYGLRDTFKDPVQRGALFCGLPLAEWLSDGRSR